LYFQNLSMGWLTMLPYTGVNLEGVLAGTLRKCQLVDLTSYVVHTQHDLPREGQIYAGLGGWVLKHIPLQNFTMSRVESCVVQE